MSLSNQFADYVRACFTGIWVQSHEQHEALLSIATECRQNDWHMASWSVSSGVSVFGPGEQSGTANVSDPLAAIRSVRELVPAEGTVVLVLQNFHRFLQSTEIMQTLADQILRGKNDRTIIVVLAPVAQIPQELEKLFVVVEHELPDREQLADIASGVATGEDEMPNGTDRQRLLDAALGLTRYEAENAFALSLIRHNRLDAETIWTLKSQALLKSGLLSLHRGGETFEQLGGLDSLKAFSLRALRRSTVATETPRPRGLLLLGVPGTGKSAFCKALGNETGRPTLVLDVGALMGSLVGQSEERTRRALQIADAMAPCVLMIDEVEKALSGVAGNAGDSGVSSRMFGSLLSWLNDHESDVFVVCTANDVSRLPPEFTRAERFDGIYFLDLPSREQRDKIWSLYLQLYQLDPQQRRPDDANWTGAEIKSCCRLSALLDVPLVQAAHNVVPVSATAAESVERLRTWASGRCLSADHPGVFQSNVKSQAKTRRSIARDSSAN